MSAEAGKRKWLGSVLWCVATGVPVAIGGYLIYDKQKKLADDPPARAVAAQPEPEAPTTIAVAPSYADPEILRRKEEGETMRQREREMRLARERANLAEAAGQAGKTGKSRVITLGPSPEAARERELQYERERLAREYAERRAQPRPRYPHEEPVGPKVYQHTESWEERQRRHVSDAPLLPFSGSGRGSYESGNYRSTSGASR